jgi:L-lactate dehydrogenase complex protein LldE
MVDAFYPEVGLAAARLLERHGVNVVFPKKQTCCGQPAFNSGYRAEAQTLARRFVTVFGELLDRQEIDGIVAPSGSCVAMVRGYYDALFETEEDTEYRDRVSKVSRATYELTEYLVRKLGVEQVEGRFEGKLTYHPCCHLLRGLRVNEEPLGLLANLPGAELVDLPAAEECCGFGGVFAIKNAEISVAMGRRKTAHIADTGARVVAVNDVSCMTHLNGLLSREGKSCRAVHIAEVLDGGTAERLNGGT